MKDIHYFDIDDELFAEIKGNFNRGINSILDGMQKKNVSDGELSLSVKISLKGVLATDRNGHETEITVPEISHKAVTKMSVKSEEKGSVKSYNVGNGRNVLALKKIRGIYAAAVTPTEASQLTFDDESLFRDLEEDDDA